VHAGHDGIKERVRQLRPAYLAPDPAGHTTYEADGIPQVRLRFALTTVPVGFCQKRTAMQFLERCGKQLGDLLSKLAPSRGLRRNSWRLACSANSRPGNPAAERAASEGLGLSTSTGTMRVSPKFRPLTVRGWAH